MSNLRSSPPLNAATSPSQKSTTTLEEGRRSRWSTSSSPWLGVTPKPILTTRKEERLEGGPLPTIPHRLFGLREDDATRRPTKRKRSPPRELEAVRIRLPTSSVSPRSKTKIYEDSCHVLPKRFKFHDEPHSRMPSPSVESGIGMRPPPPPERPKVFLPKFTKSSDPIALQLESALSQTFEWLHLAVEEDREVAGRERVLEALARYSMVLDASILQLEQQPQPNSSMLFQTSSLARILFDFASSLFEIASDLPSSKSNLGGSFGDWVERRREVKRTAAGLVAWMKRYVSRDNAEYSIERKLECLLRGRFNKYVPPDLQHEMAHGLARLMALGNVRAFREILEKCGGEDEAVRMFVQRMACVDDTHILNPSDSEKAIQELRKAASEVQEVFTIPPFHILIPTFRLLGNVPGDPQAVIEATGFDEDWLESFMLGLLWGTNEDMSYHSVMKKQSAADSIALLFNRHVHKHPRYHKALKQTRQGTWQHAVTTLLRQDWSGFGDFLEEMTSQGAPWFPVLFCDALDLLEVVGKEKRGWSILEFLLTYTDKLYDQPARWFSAAAIIATPYIAALQEDFLQSPAVATQAEMEAVERYIENSMKGLERSEVGTYEAYLTWSLRFELFAVMATNSWMPIEKAAAAEKLRRRVLSDSIHNARHRGLRTDEVLLSLVDIMTHDAYRDEGGGKRGLAALRQIAGELVQVDLADFDVRKPSRSHFLFDPEVQRQVAILTESSRPVPLMDVLLGYTRHAPALDEICRNGTSSSLTLHRDRDAVTWAIRTLCLKTPIPRRLRVKLLDYTLDALESDGIVGSHDDVFRLLEISSLDCGIDDSDNLGLFTEEKRRRLRMAALKTSIYGSPLLE